MTTTRREFFRRAAALAGGTLLLGSEGRPGPFPEPDNKSRVVSVAAGDILAEGSYNPGAVARAFAAGMKELTGRKKAEEAWASLFSPADVVGIKVNCIGAPKISTSPASVGATIAGSPQRRRPRQQYHRLGPLGPEAPARRVRGQPGAGRRPGAGCLGRPRGDRALGRRL